MIMDCEGGGTTGSHQQQQQQGMEEMRKEKQQVEVVAVEEEHKCNESLPPGFRFHPTDEELVSYYLTNKILDSTFSGRAIAEADLNKCEPWDLPDKAKMGEKEWYFFSQRDRKYPTGLRTNRATEAGYWKTTGKDREVYNSQTSALVGMKKTLVFYKGRAPKGEKTNWVMHEYRIEGKYSYNRLPKNCKDEWVVCRIFQKNAGGKKSSVSTGFLDRNSFLELPGSPSLPSLLESPYNTETPCNDQEAAGSVECESSSTKPHPIRQTNQQQLSHYLQTTFPVSESSNQLLPDMDRLLKNSSYMSNLSFMSDNSPSSIFNMHGLLSLANLNMHQKLQPFASQFMFNHNPLLSCSFPPTMNINNFPQDATTANLNNNNQPTVSPMLRSFSSQSNLMIDPSSSITSASVPPQNLDFPTSNTEDQIVAVGSSTAAADAPVMDFDSIWNFREHPF